MPLRRVPGRRLLTIAVTAASVAAAGAAVTGSSAGATVPVGAMTARTVQQVRPGVTLTEGMVRVNGSPQQVYQLGVDLRQASIGTVLANNRLNSPGETVLSMAQRTGAIAGVNGDLFDLIANRSPYGGVVSNGNVIKTPLDNTPEQFYVQSNGVAGIGPVTFTGTVTFRKVVVTPKGRRTVTVKQAFKSINNIAMAARSRLTLVTSSLGTSAIPRGCIVAVLGSVRNGWKLLGRAITGPSLAALPASRRALLGCHNAAPWLRTIPRGAVLQLHWLMAANGAPAGVQIKTLIGGPRILVVHGAAYGDPHSGFVTFGRNPETWVCVDQSGRNVQIGVLDGRDWASRGVTLSELQAYLVSEHCWHSIVLDGGGSSAVAATVGGGPLQIQDNPATGTWALRPLADALMVYSSIPA